jgi:hypothetical protein
MNRKAHLTLHTIPTGELANGYKILCHCRPEESQREAESARRRGGGFSRTCKLPSNHQIQRRQDLVISAQIAARRITSRQAIFLCQ